MMTIESVMETKVITVPDTTSLLDVWKLFSKKKINSTAVVDKNIHLVGIITKQDMLKLLYPDYKAYSDDVSFDTQDVTSDSDFKEIMLKKVLSVMCKNVIHTRKSTNIMRALARMIVHRVNQLPVVDDENHVIGIITKGTIFEALYRFHKSLFRKKSK